MQRLARLVLVLLGLLVCAAVLTSVQAQEPPTNAVDANRVVVRFTQEGFELVGVNPLVKTLPPSDGLPEGDGELSGFWYELQDSEGQVLYRRVIGNPVPLFFEGPALGPGPMSNLRERADTVRRAMDEQDNGSGRTGSTRNGLRGRRARGNDRGGDEIVPREASVRETGAMNPRRFKRDFSGSDDGIGDPVVSEAIPEETVFSLLIPRAGEGDVLVLFSSPLRSGAQAEPASQVGKLELTDTSGGGEGTGEGEGKGGAA